MYLKVPVPFLQAPVPFGQAVKAVTSEMGVKPCGGCQKRAEKLDRAGELVPARDVLQGLRNLIGRP